MVERGDMPHELLQFSRLASMLAAAAAIVFYRRQIQEALERFNRRGPRPPTGPLPANDAFVVLRRRTRPTFPRDI
jgi:hypothetical protein